jgi:hypothetical protein
MNKNLKPMLSLDNLSTGARTGSGEVLNYTFYDVIKLATGATEQRFFQIPLGQGSPVKNLSQTNIKTPGSMPNAQRLTVHNIKVQYKSRTVMNEAVFQKVQNFIWDAVVVFRMPGKDDFGTWKLNEMFCQALNVVITPAVAGNNVAGVGTGIYNGIFNLKVPIILPALESFEFVVSCPAIDADLNNHELYIGLNGNYERAN